ncbi:MAG: hypothetical protein QOH66_1507 [Actinomycetota bacterium]|jgi:hypothetical protein|nr:hypothetical protein [Actinomycetota bacterium]
MDDASVVATQSAYSGILAPPDVPPGTIEVPPGNELFLVERGVGSQNYIRLPLSPPGTGSDWVLFAPQATLFDDGGRQIGTHFASSSPPKEDPTNPIPTWQDNDNSAAWATREKSMDSPDGSIPWLLLKVVATRRGKAGGHRLAKTTYIQRVRTTGGVKPPSDGTTPTDVGSRNFVPYTAQYYFYRRALSA